jgi:hypothetical protein
MQPQTRPEPYRKLIIAVSIIIPLAVAALFGIKVPGYDFSFLPPIYATINGITAVLLVIAFLAIKNGRRLLHERTMKTCIGLSVMLPGDVCDLPHDQRNHSLWRNGRYPVHLFFHPGYAYCTFCGDYPDGVIFVCQGTFGRF